jgi:hypothetical protein
VGGVGATAGAGVATASLALAVSSSSPFFFARTGALMGLALPSLVLSFAVSSPVAAASAFFTGARLAFTFSTSTFSAVSTAVPPPSPLNHSRMVISRPTETGDMWFLMIASGIPSAWHFATMTLESIPISFASWKSFLLANQHS